MYRKDKKTIIDEFIHRWLLLKILDNVSFAKYLQDRGIRRVALYGYSLLCKMLVAEIYGNGIEIPYIIDRRAFDIESNFQIYRIEDIDDECNEKIDAVIICIPSYSDSFIVTAKKYIKVPLIDIEELLYEL